MWNRSPVYAAFLALFILSCAGNGEHTEQPVPVRVVVLTPETISRTVYAPCRLEAGSEAIVSVAVPSVVLEVLVHTGDTVSAGQRLLVLRTDDMRRASVSSAAAMMEAARASDEYARNNLERAEVLFRDGAMSLQEYQTRETEAQAAAAGFLQTASAYSAAVSSAGNGFVNAPFSGVSGRVLATEGNLASGPLLSIYSSDVLKAELLVSPRHLSSLQPGIPAVFITDHFPGRVFSGSVTSVSGTADPVSGLVALSVQFNDSTGMLIPGLSGMTMLSLETRDSALVLGENSLTPVGDCCWEAAVIRSGTVEKVQVSTGISCGNRHEITAGLLPGDSVITLGHTIVSSGETVRVVN